MEVILNYRNFEEVADNINLSVAINNRLYFFLFT